ncbi:unnamed protein product [Peniophora sp. CBMAI 1063]|nr:unnamed protein product [Peniophora sp. CBMAI 1063]
MSTTLLDPSKNALEALQPFPGAAELASQVLRKVYAASGECKIVLRDDQGIAAARLALGHDTFHIARTGSGKTLQIIAAALLNPGKLILVFSPLLALQANTVETISKYGLKAVAVNSEQSRHPSSG